MSLVRFKALHRSGYSSVAGKLGPFFGRKDRARRMPQEKGIPRKLELRQLQYNTIVLLLQFNDNYIACAVTSNSYRTLCPCHRMTPRRNIITSIEAYNNNKKR